MEEFNPIPPQKETEKSQLRKAKKLLVVDAIFICIDFIVTYLMFKLWFWLFDNKIILIILTGVTVLSLIRQLWKAFDSVSEHLRLLKT